MPFGQHIETLGLYTDLYQLTMAQGYWAETVAKGLPEQIGCFEGYTRKMPFGKGNSEGGYAISCGLSDVAAYLDKFAFSDDDIAYLRALRNPKSEKPLFCEGFLDYLKNLRLNLTIDAMPDGTAVFVNEPLIRVTGSMLQGQLVETAILNMMGYKTLVATKAARIVSVLPPGSEGTELGLRRAQVPGGVEATAAAIVGGFMSTSNTLAAKLLDVNVGGTMAHSWVMSHDDELTAFRAYAETMPDNCVFLVDTFDSIEGTRNAIIVAKELRAKGHEIVGIRLDSGDLAKLSIEIRELLDASGFPNAKIIASNDLDEEKIEALAKQGARIDVYGVGTQLVTAADQPALGGVYKLVAKQNAEGAWQSTIKVATPEKTSVPGRKQVRRYSQRVDDGNGNHVLKFLGDAIYDIDAPPRVDSPCSVVDLRDPTTEHEFSSDTQSEDLLVRFYENGERVYQLPTIQESSARRAAQLSALSPATKRLMNPEPYPALIEKSLYDRRQKMIRDCKKQIKLSKQLAEADARISPDVMPLAVTGSQGVMGAFSTSMNFFSAAAATDEENPGTILEATAPTAAVT